MMRIIRFSLVAASVVAIGFAAQAAEIDFEGIAPGTIVDELTTGAGVTGSIPGPVGVDGFNPALAASAKCANGPPCNAAVVFDSANPPGIDFDLGTPNECVGGPGVDLEPGDGFGGECGSIYENLLPLGNILQVNEMREIIDRDNSGTIDNADSPVTRTDDADLRGEYIEFDFTGFKRSGKGTATVGSISYMDNDEGEFAAQIELYGNFPDKFIALPALGDNGVLTIPIAIDGVSRARVVLNGSGAVTSVVVNEQVERPCWVTLGGFDKGTNTDASGKKICTFGGNVGPPPSGAFEVNWHSGAFAGSVFHTNDIEAIECVDMGSTGPQQPGGKKGLVVDTLFFECDGLFNHLPGYTCDGYFKDSGEPQGKKANDRDEINFTVRDSVGAVVAECIGDMEGGNVQIHPPVGKP
jgi:hypothetical protein